MTKTSESQDPRQFPPTVLGVVGLGYVGLPLAVEAARSGIRVVGVDVDPAVVDGVNRGHSHVEDISSDSLAPLVDGGWIQATTAPVQLHGCDAVSICVPTPLSKTRDPDISYILAAAQAVAQNSRPGQLVVLESTTYPGTTREVLLPLLEAEGLIVGEDVHLCFSPERVDPGNRTWGIHNTPKVIGGITEACTAAGVSLYSRFIERVVPVSSPEAAELTKILENTFRAVNIGLVNETAQIADRLGVDIWEVVEAAATKPFGFMKFTPGPGLGGHCIPVDPHYLSWKMRSLDTRTRFIDLAAEVNGEMPPFVVGKVQEALNGVERAVRGARVLLLGMAYKPDVGDIRESPALVIHRLLEEMGAQVSWHDPHVPGFRDVDGHWHEGIPLGEGTLEEADVVVLVTNHSAFDPGEVLSRSTILVDARNATGGLQGERGTRRWIVKSPAIDPPGLWTRGTVGSAA